MPMEKQKPIIAMLYDFDKTLSTKAMQEYSFIPSLHMSPQEFWQESDQLAEQQKMDQILAYMYLMIKRSLTEGHSVRREDFVKQGREIVFFAGVESWFDRMRRWGEDLGITIEHYIISSGLREIIEGSSIARHFRQIYACEFYYDGSGQAVWPKLAVNYTGKTQFLFRINKGVLDVSNDRDLNRYTPDSQRRIPFRNMLYIGDGLTDVPCMKLVKSYHGQSIAVYPPGKRQEVEELFRAKRVDFLLPADYREGGELEETVKVILQKMAAASFLAEKHFQQKLEMEEATANC